MSFLGCLFAALFVVLFMLLSFGLSLINAVLRLFGIRLPKAGQKGNAEVRSEAQPQKKRFADDEGEYVDFEEV